MCLGAAARVLARQVGQIESINDLHDEASQVVLREPAIHRRGQQVVGFTVGKNEVGHAQNYLSGQVTF